MRGGVDAGDHRDGELHPAGLGAITSPDALRFLLGLPAGEPVPLTALTHAERSDLAALPRGAVALSDDSVVRFAVPPVQVDVAVVAAPTWRLGLERAGRFVPFCARAMVLPAPPRDVGDMAMEAGFYGIGVIVATPGTDPQVLVAPVSFRRRRVTVAGWRFPEEVYRQVR